MVTSVATSEITWLENILETIFDNHSYIIQFAMVHPEYLKDTTSVEDNGIIIAQTGVTSKFQIQNLNLENYVGWNHTSRSAIAFQGTIDIYEPLGLNYYDAIFSASQDLGIANHLRAGYVLSVTWAGQNEQGLYEANIPVYRWPILVRKVKSIPNEHGTSHSIDFVSVSNGAFDVFTEQIGQQITIKGVKTYNEFIKELEKTINKHQSEKELETQVHPDQYTIQIKDKSKDSVLGDPEIKNYNFAVSKYKTTSKLQIEYTGGVGFDFTIPAGSLISEVLGLAYMNTDEAQKTITTINKTGAQSKANDEATVTEGSGLPMFYKVDGDVEYGEYDSWRNEYQKKITYTLVPSIEVGILYDSNNYNNLIINKSYQQNRLKEIQKYQLLRKRYDYWYTGRNTSILNFNFDLNYAYVALQPIDRGTVNDPGNNLGSQELGTDIAIDKERKDLNTLKKLKTEQEQLVKRLEQAKKTNDGNAINDLSQQVQQNQQKINTKKQEIISFRENKEASTFGNNSTNPGSSNTPTKTSRIKGRRYIEQYFYAEGGKNTEIPVRWKEIDLSSYTGFLPPGELDASSVMMGAVYANLLAEQSLVRINLDIVGDPYWFGFTPNFLSGESFATDNVLSEKYADYKKGSNLFYFTLQLPKETLYGEPEESDFNTKVSIVQGLYQVIKVRSTFSNGQFTQSLEAVKDVNTNSQYLQSINIE